MIHLNSKIAQLIFYQQSNAYSTVADEINATRTVPPGLILYSANVTISNRTQVHYLPSPIYCPKGTMLVVTMHDGLLAINTYQSSMYSDFDWLQLNLGLIGPYSLAVGIAQADEFYVGPALFTQLGPKLIKANLVCNGENVSAEFQTNVAESEFNCCINRLKFYETH